MTSTPSTSSSHCRPASLLSKPFADLPYRHGILSQRIAPLLLSRGPADSTMEQMSEDTQGGDVQLRLGFDDEGVLRLVREIPSKGSCSVSSQRDRLPARSSPCLHQSIPSGITGKVVVCGSGPTSTTSAWSGHIPMCEPSPQTASPPGRLGIASAMQPFVSTTNPYDCA